MSVHFSSIGMNANDKILNRSTRSSIVESKIRAYRNAKYAKLVRKILKIILEIHWRDVARLALHFVPIRTRTYLFLSRMIYFRTEEVQQIGKGSKSRLTRDVCNYLLCDNSCTRM